MQEGCYSAVTDPGRCCPSSASSSAPGGFTAVNGGWAGSRASEPPPAPFQQQQQQREEVQPRSSSAYCANGASRRGVVGSIRSLLNNGGEEAVEAEQARKLGEIEREYGDVVRRSGSASASASASASEGSTPTTGGQMEGVVVGAAVGGPQAVETTA